MTHIAEDELEGGGVLGGGLLAVDVVDGAVRGAVEDVDAEGAGASVSGPVACALWGVLNVTPDSFSDGGLYLGQSEALARAEALRQAGADVIDVGGESTRPAGKTYGEGYQAVSVDEEIRRTEPVVAALAAAGIAVSIDTTKAEVARRPRGQARSTSTT